MIGKCEVERGVESIYFHEGDMCDRLVVYLKEQVTNLMLSSL